MSRVAESSLNEQLFGQFLRKLSTKNKFAYTIEGKTH